MVAKVKEPTPDTGERVKWRHSVSKIPAFECSSAEDRLRLLYQLTRAEARVAVLLGRGHTMKEAAARLNVKMSTVRTHLQRIYDKTGTHRQAALVRLIIMSP